MFQPLTNDIQFLDINCKTDVYGFLHSNEETYCFITCLQNKYYICYVEMRYNLFYIFLPENISRPCEIVKNLKSYKAKNTYFLHYMEERIAR